MNNLKVIKRDGRIKDFDEVRIKVAISRAYKDVYSDDSKFKDEYIFLEPMILNEIDKVENNKINIEDIQDIIINCLKKINKEVALSYEKYRKEREETRQKNSELMKIIGSIGVETDRDNANVGNNFSSKLLRIASETNKLYNLSQMPEHLAKLHKEGDLYYHDLDSFNLTINCLHIPTKEVLEKGFNTGYGTLRKAKRISSASELSCILLQSSQNDMFGGQSHPDFDNDLGSFVKYTRKEIYNELKSIIDVSKYSKEYINHLTEEKVEKDIRQAMQGIVYNLNTMHSRAGSQVPFSSVNIGIPTGTEQDKHDTSLVCRIFLEEYEKGLGKKEQPIFPNIIFRVKDGINAKPSDPYYSLLKVACRVASGRMNPTFMNIDADFNKEYYDKGYMPAEMG